MAKTPGLVQREATADDTRPVSAEPAAARGFELRPPSVPELLAISFGAFLLQAFYVVVLIQAAPLIRSVPGLIAGLWNEGCRWWIWKSFCVAGLNLSSMQSPIALIAPSLFALCASTTVLVFSLVGWLMIARLTAAGVTGEDIASAIIDAMTPDDGRLSPRAPYVGIPLTIIFLALLGLFLLGQATAGCDASTQLSAGMPSWTHLCPGAPPLHALILPVIFLSYEFLTLFVTQLIFWLEI